MTTLSSAASTPATTIHTSAMMAAWTTRQISEQRRLRATRATVLGMLQQVTREQDATLVRALREAQQRRFG